MDNFKKKHVLIIDDDGGVAKTISKVIERLGVESDISTRLGDGMHKLGEKNVDVVLLDVNLPDGNGIEMIPRILDRESPPLVIIMTAYSNADGAELAIESGAWDYLQKPVSSKDLKLQIIRALEFQDQKNKAEQYMPFDAPEIIGNSPAMRKCIEQAAQIVCSDANVLITGETGTGKELFAKAIHDNSARRNGEFIVVDCSVLSESLIESVLFGHEKGAFTGAEKNRKGLVALANGGTLFLDEVAELPESIQASFLRVLQEKTFRPVGSEKELYSDFRVICATNKNLEKMESDKLFRTDLLYRLKTFVLNLPPLKERADDIPKIAGYHIKKSCAEHNIPDKECSPDFIEMLEKYDWPGNVRELINTIEIGVTSAHFENTLFAFHLPSTIRAKIARSQITQPQSDPFEKSNQALIPESVTLKELLERTEKKYLETLYVSTNGDIQQLIDQTDLSRTVLYRKLKEYNIK